MKRHKELAAPSSTTKTPVRCSLLLVMFTRHFKSSKSVLLSVSGGDTSVYSEEQWDPIVVFSFDRFSTTRLVKSPAFPRKTLAEINGNQ